jgi:hypothetical protein
MDGRCPELDCSGDPSIDSQRHRAPGLTRHIPNEEREGSFESTKGAFYEVFPNVVQSRSYQEGRSNNFPRTPKAALPFRMVDEADSDEPE